MPIKPGPQFITIGGTNLLADDVRVSYDVQYFDRVEYDHLKLRNAPLTTGVTPLLGQLLGNTPYEIVIDCAVDGNAFPGSEYVPRPLTPNIVPTDTDNIKKRIDIIRYTIAGGSTPETASAGSNVDTVFALRQVHRNKLAQFENRLAIFNGEVPYEQLVAAQSDDIQTLYFKTGTVFTMPGVTLSDIILTEFSYGFEYLVPADSSGTSFEVYKGFNLILETRLVVTASAS